MSYTKIQNDFNKFDDIDRMSLPVDAEVDTQYIDNTTGDIMIYNGAFWTKLASAFAKEDFVWEEPRKVGGTPIFIYDALEFDRHVRDLALFGSIDKKEYFKLVDLYNTQDTGNQVLASAIIKEQHKILRES
jgi:hypothetical protein